jgi:hypothetical protein
MMFRVVFWDVLPCKMIVDNYFTRQYIPEDNSETNFFLAPFLYYAYFQSYWDSNPGQFFGLLTLFL